MADPRREQDDEPLTQLDVDIDKSELDSIIEREREATTSPGGLGPNTEARTDDEPLTMEPPRVLGVPRLRAHTMLGVAPPSSGASAPPTTQPRISSGIPKIVFEGDDRQEITETKPADIPRILVEGDDEQTTMVGKLLAEAHAEVAKKLKEPAEPDLYADETATSVGDAEKIIAAANVATVPKVSAHEGEDIDETTVNHSVRDALMEDVTSKRDAINVESALARAAELRAEAEKKKKQAKKRTMHGLGDGPLRLPARTPQSEEDIPTFENVLPETGERPASTRSSAKLVAATMMSGAVEPADGEMETLSAVAPHPASMRRINTEPETMPVEVPSTSRERQVTAPADPAAMLGGPSYNQTLNSAPNVSPYTQPMPYAPTVRMDERSGGLDPALKQTMNSPMHQAAAQHAGPHPMTPSGGVHAYNSTPMPVHAPQYSIKPHSGPAAFAHTAVATGSGPAVVEGPKKRGGGAIIFVLLLLVGLGGVGYWQRATLKAVWDQYRQPAPPSTVDGPAASAPATASTATVVPPPVTTETAPHGSSSAAPHGSSAAPRGSASAAPHGSGSAAPSASASSKTPPKKAPPPWRPPPKPKPAGASPKPKPVDDNRGF